MILIPFHKSPAPQREREGEREREIIISERLTCCAQPHNPFANHNEHRLFA